MSTAAVASSVTSSKVAINTGAWDAIMQASPIVQLTLVILVALSIFCWAIAFAKYRNFKNLTSANERFTHRFYKASSLESLYEDIDSFKDSSIARVFQAGYLELKKLAERKPEGGQAGLLVSGSDNLERTLRKSMDAELAAMESRLSLLATTGSTGPFIGLFGTVWGIMGSFHKIGATGSASLAVVAPGISEALVATAIGLAAAIPAVALYNHFIAQIKKEEMALNSFSTDFLNIAKRNFFKE
ncbi:MAG: protein TolQ [Proteobacteria bacterium]|jgi:biopolymer transport protein TolQ|nr:protein TolQ [Pseudomonadota bacterium]